MQTSSFNPTQVIQTLRSQDNPGLAAKVLEENLDEIIAIWEAWCRAEVPAARDRSEIVLRDKAKPFLKAMVQALTPNSDKYDATDGNDLSRQHGQHRASTEGYNLEQVLVEYALLRKTLVHFLHENSSLTRGEAEIINDSIDKAMAQAAQEFTAFKESALQVALKAAERSNEALERFAAIAAHDLKAPLNSIFSFSEIVDEKVRHIHGEEVREALDFIRAASVRMRDLIDRILEYAHITSTPPKFQVVDLNGVYSVAASNLSAFIEERRAHVNHSPLPQIWGDVELLTQAFQNLMANGIKYNKEPVPELSASAEEFADSWIIRIHDNGIGFDPNEKENIFAQYKRLHGNSEYQGSGLGLATVRRIIEIHGGKVWAESIPGDGSVFCMRLPKRGMNHMHS